MVAKKILIRFRGMKYCCVTLWSSAQTKQTVNPLSDFSLVIENGVVKGRVKVLLNKKCKFVKNLWYCAGGA